MNVPERAATAGWRAFCDSLGQIELTSAVADAITAAAPIILADGYRARATECNCADDCELLERMAGELDPGDPS